ncbi:MAG: sorbitol-6-phosphate dehydrogenase [Oscillospiraceae bacterium]|nr:sorbitol-6-phosphate dehydrogenase [Oscillospiraceae bacterium]
MDILKKVRQTVTVLTGLKRMKDKVVVVTGGAQGLGEALCHRMADEGAKVVVADLNLEGAEKVASEINGIAVKVDVSSYEDNEAMINAAVEKYGKVDVVVANAGIVLSGPVDEIPLNHWQKVIDIDLVGFFYTCRAAVIQFKKQGFGNIVQINSKSGHKGSAKNSAYAAAKFGGNGLVQSLALELAEEGIRVNAVCPGNLLNGPLWKNQLFKQYAANQGCTEEEIYQKYVNQSPMKRSCEYEDIANVVVFLASDEAGFMTGQALNVTGGQQMCP